LPQKTRRPFYKDPLSILGWGIALGAIIGYWYYFVKPHVPEPGEQVARITALAGEVRLKPNEQEIWNPARLQDALHVGDVVQTEPRSGAAISFNSGSVVRVRPDSIAYLGGSPEQSTAAWRVEAGRVNFTVGDQVTQIVTPTAQRNASRRWLRPVVCAASSFTRCPFVSVAARGSSSPFLPTPSRRATPRSMARDRV